MLVGRFVILALIYCVAGHNALPATRARTSYHPASPAVSSAPARHSQPAEDSEVPVPLEEDLLQSLSDSPDAAPSLSRLPLLPAPLTRASNQERSLSLSGLTELLYSLRHLRI